MTTINAYLTFNGNCREAMTFYKECLGSDMVDPVGFFAGNNVSLSLICKNDEEIENSFKSLAEGGSIKYPLHNFYAGKIGGLIDKFGISWILKLQNRKIAE